jgi:phospholipid/cholesterol/gamma-HCH transport system substrate-binding protein
MRTEVKVGIFFIVGLLILLAVFEFVGKIPFLTKEYSLRTYFKSVGELNEGSPVDLQGVEVGEVSEVKIADGKIEVTMRVNKGTPIKKDSVATIKLTSPLGISYINLTFGSPESPIAPPGSVLPSEEPADISDILAKVESTMSSLESVFGAFGENKERISSLLNNLDSVLGGAARGEGTLGRLLKDESLYKETKETLASINEIAVSIKQGEGTLGKLVNDESLYNETKKTVADLGQLAEKLSNAEGSLGKLLNDDALYNQTTEAATNLNSILRKVNKGEGTLGKLVNEDSLYFDAKNAVKKVEKGVDTQEDLAPLSVIGTAFGVITLF